MLPYGFWLRHLLASLPQEGKVKRWKVYKKTTANIKLAQTHYAGLKGSKFAKTLFRHNSMKCYVITIIGVQT